MNWSDKPEELEETAEKIADPVILAEVTSSDGGQNEIKLSGIEGNTFIFDAYDAPDSVKVSKNPNAIIIASKKVLTIDSVALLKSEVPGDVVLAFVESDEGISVTVVVASHLIEATIRKVIVSESTEHIKYLRESPNSICFNVSMVTGFPLPLFGAASGPFFSHSLFSQIEDVLNATGDEERVTAFLAEVSDAELEIFAKRVPDGKLDSLVVGFSNAVIEEQHRRTLAKQTETAETVTSS